MYAGPRTSDMIGAVMEHLEMDGCAAGIPRDPANRTLPEPFIDAVREFIEQVRAFHAGFGRDKYRLVAADRRINVMNDG